jgi:hypothetical protein
VDVTAGRGAESCRPPTEPKRRYRLGVNVEVWLDDDGGKDWVRLRNANVREPGEVQDGEVRVNVTAKDSGELVRNWSSELEKWSGRNVMVYLGPPPALTIQVAVRIAQMWRGRLAVVWDMDAWLPPARAPPLWESTEAVPERVLTIHRRCMIDSEHCEVCARHDHWCRMVRKADGSLDKLGLATALARDPGWWPHQAPPAEWPCPPDSSVRIGPLTRTESDAAELTKMALRLIGERPPPPLHRLPKATGFEYRPDGMLFNWRSSERPSKQPVSRPVGAEQEELENEVVAAVAAGFWRVAPVGGAKGATAIAFLVRNPKKRMCLHPEEHNDMTGDASTWYDDAAGLLRNKSRWLWTIDLRDAFAHLGLSAREWRMCRVVLMRGAGQEKWVLEITRLWFGFRQGPKAFCAALANTVIFARPSPESTQGAHVQYVDDGGGGEQKWLSATVGALSFLALMVYDGWCPSVGKTYWLPCWRMKMLGLVVDPIVRRLRVAPSSAVKMLELLCVVEEQIEQASAVDGRILRYMQVVGGRLAFYTRALPFLSLLRMNINKVVLGGPVTGALRAEIAVLKEITPTLAERYAAVDPTPPWLVIVSDGSMDAGGRPSGGYYYRSMDATGQSLSTLQAVDLEDVVPPGETWSSTVVEVASVCAAISHAVRAGVQFGAVVSFSDSSAGVAALSRWRSGSIPVARIIKNIFDLLWNSRTGIQRPLIAQWTRRDTPTAVRADAASDAVSRVVKVQAEVRKLINSLVKNIQVDFAAASEVVAMGKEWAVPGGGGMRRELLQHMVTTEIWAEGSLKLPSQLDLSRRVFVALQPAVEPWIGLLTPGTRRQVPELLVTLRRERTWEALVASLGVPSARVWIYSATGPLIMEVFGVGAIGSVSAARDIAKSGVEWRSDGRLGHSWPAVGKGRRTGQGEAVRCAVESVDANQKGVNPADGIDAVSGEAKTPGPSVSALRKREAVRLVMNRIARDRTAKVEALHISVSLRAYLKHFVRGMKAQGWAKVEDRGKKGERVGGREEDWLDAQRDVRLGRKGARMSGDSSFVVSQASPTPGAQVQAETPRAQEQAEGGDTKRVRSGAGESSTSDSDYVDDPVSSSESPASSLEHVKGREQVSWLRGKRVVRRQGGIKFAAARAKATVPAVETLRKQGDNGSSSHDCRQEAGLGGCSAVAREKTEGAGADATEVNLDVRDDSWPHGGRMTKGVVDVAAWNGIPLVTISDSSQSPVRSTVDPGVGGEMLRVQRGGEDQEGRMEAVGTTGSTRASEGGETRSPERAARGPKWSRSRETVDQGVGAVQGVGTRARSPKDLLCETSGESRVPGPFGMWFSPGGEVRPALPPLHGPAQQDRTPARQRVPPPSFESTPSPVAGTDTWRQMWCKGCSRGITPEENARFCDETVCGEDFPVCRTCAPKCRDEAPMRCPKHQMRAAVPDESLLTAQTAMAEAKVGTMARLAARVWARAAGVAKEVLKKHPLNSPEMGMSTVTELAAEVSGSAWTEERKKALIGPARRLLTFLKVAKLTEELTDRKEEVLLLYAHARMEEPLEGWSVDIVGTTIRGEIGRLAAAFRDEGVDTGPVGGPSVRAYITRKGGAVKPDHTVKWPVTLCALLRVEPKRAGPEQTAWAAAVVQSYYALRPGYVEQLKREDFSPLAGGWTLRWTNVHKTRRGDMGRPGQRLPPQVSVGRGAALDRALAIAKKSGIMFPGVSAEVITKFVKLWFGERSGFVVSAHGIRAGTDVALQALGVPDDVIASWGWWARLRRSTGYYGAISAAACLAISDRLHLVDIDPLAPGWYHPSGVPGRLPDWDKIRHLGPPLPEATAARLAMGAAGDDDESDEEERPALGTPSDGWNAIHNKKETPYARLRKRQ